MGEQSVTEKVKQVNPMEGFQLTLAIVYDHPSIYCKNTNLLKLDKGPVNLK